MGPQSTTPRAQSTTPGAQSTSPGAQSTTPRAQSTTPGAQSTSPGAQSTTPGAQSSSPGAQSTTTGAQSATPGAQSTSPGAQSTMSGEQSTASRPQTTMAPTEEPTTPAPVILNRSAVRSSVEEDGVLNGDLLNSNVYDISFTENGHEVKENDVTLVDAKPLCSKSGNNEVCLEIYSVNVETGYFCTKLSGYLGDHKQSIELDIKCMTMT